VAEVFDKLVVIVVTIVLMFIVPVILVANRMDQSAQSYMDSAVISFVDNVRVMGKITPDAYKNLAKALDTIQPGCEIDIVVSLKEVIPKGEGDVYTYYRDIYTSELIDIMYSGDETDTVYLCNGDYIKVSVKTTAPTIAQRMLAVNDFVPLYVTYGGWIRSDG